MQLFHLVPFFVGLVSDSQMYPLVPCSVKILKWLEDNPLLADRVLEGVVRVITLTGDRTAAGKTEVLFKDRHWESIKRVNCRGRCVRHHINLRKHDLGDCVDVF